MVELGFEKEERLYHPHVTAGRVKEARGSAENLWKSDALLGSSALAEIIVYESRTRSAGAEYVARARVPLGDKEKR
jgi:2'-5' RNA ligase